MIGGKLIAEGGYGCIFNPGINCDGSIMKTKNMQVRYNVMMRVQK